MATIVPNSRHPWLTRQRLRAHGWVFAVCLWGAYAWIMASPGLLDRHGLIKGTDFLHFYTLGWLALEHRGTDLYNMAAQSVLAGQRVPQAQHIYFVALYGPQVSLLFAPLAGFPYGAALAVWLVGNAVLYGLCCYLVWKTCASLRPDGRLVLLLALAYPAFFHLMAWGQTSGLALACFTAAYLALRSEKKFLAGLAIGCLMVNHHSGWRLRSCSWGPANGNWFREPRWLGWRSGRWDGPTSDGRATTDYFVRLLHVREVLPQLEPRLYQMHSLRSVLDAIGTVAAGRILDLSGQYGFDLVGVASLLEKQN